MGAEWWWIAAAVVFAATILACLLWRPLTRARRESLLAGARKDFHRRRESLEAKFVQLASRSGKPRGLRWVDCDFENDVTYARDRASGQISAFVAVTIRFEAIVGGDMEEVEAVGNLRAATSVFLFENSQWSTQGRAIFNLNPSEAIQFYQSKLELVGHESAGGVKS